MKGITIREAGLGDIPLLTKLARDIWQEYYPPIIGEAQVEYMLDLMYSSEVLEKDMKSGVLYLIAENSGVPAGFSASEIKGKSVFLHKIYVLGALRAKGAGYALLHETERRYPDAEIILLQVNRKNITAINFYFRQGFRIRSVYDKPIGKGFTMEDFLMEKAIPKGNGNFIA